MIASLWDYLGVTCGDLFSYGIYKSLLLLHVHVHVYLHVKVTTIILCTTLDLAYSINRGPQPNEDEQQTSTAERVSDKGGGVTSDLELQRLRDLLQQRDDEINVLLKMLKQERRRAGEAEVALKEAGLSLDKKSRSSPILGRTSPIQVEGPVPNSMMSLVKAGRLSASRDSAIGSAVSTRIHTTGTPQMGSSSSGEQSSHSSATSAHSMVESRSSQDWNAVKAGTTTLCTYIFLLASFPGSPSTRAIYVCFACIINAYVNCARGGGELGNEAIHVHVFLYCQYNIESLLHVHVGSVWAGTGWDTPRLGNVCEDKPTEFSSTCKLYMITVEKSGILTTYIQVFLLAVA